MMCSAIFMRVVYISLAHSDGLIYPHYRSLALIPSPLVCLDKSGQRRFAHTLLLFIAVLASAIMAIGIGIEDLTETMHICASPNAF